MDGVAGKVRNSRNAQGAKACTTAQWCARKATGFVTRCIVSPTSASKPPKLLLAMTAMTRTSEHDILACSDLWAGSNDLRSQSHVTRKM